MKHASDEGTLPANVEQQRTRVSVDQDAPRHTSTVEYAGAYYGSGVDNSFSMERFSRDFKIDIKSLDEEELVFDMIGIDPAIANAFRRILLSEVPTMAIEKVFILNNTSMIQDEMLSHRLGLVPIKADPRKFRERAAEEDADEHNVISFRLQVKCEADRGAAAPGGSSFGTAATRGTAAAGGGGAGPARPINSQVLSSQLQWIPQGEQAERFRDAPIRPVNEDILLAKLKPGQEIELEAWCERGVGKTHAKWSPVATASYRLLPEVTLGAPLKGDSDKPSAAHVAPQVFDASVEGAPPVTVVKAARPRPCTMSRQCLREPTWADRVKCSRVKDHFIFSVESTGILPPEVLVQEAVNVLMRKAATISEVLKDAVMGQATTADH